MGQLQMKGMTMIDTSVVCFGEVLLRLSAPGRELLLQTPRLDVHVGGAEANVAIALARFGHAVSMASVLPDNALGEAAKGELRRHGVDTSRIAALAGRMGLYFLETGAANRPSEVLYDRAHSAFATFPANDYDWERLLAGAGMLHLSGVSPAVGAQASAASVAVARAARERGLHVVFDGNFRKKLWEAWDGNPQRILGEIFANAQTIFADHRDIGLVLGRDFSEEPLDCRFSNAADAAFERFPQLQRIATMHRVQHNVDDHELSASMRTQTGSFSVAAIRITPIVDRIGTGDAFAAGVLHGLLTGMGDQEALQFGLSAGSLKHSIPGDCLRADAASVAQLSGDFRFDVKR
jgi:2-dehydro-3-deoxygluconokinase